MIRVRPARTPAAAPASGPPALEGDDRGERERERESLRVDRGEEEGRREQEQREDGRSDPLLAKVAPRPLREEEERDEERNGRDDASRRGGFDPGRPDEETHEARVEREKRVVRLLPDPGRRIPVAGLGEVHVPPRVPPRERRDAADDVPGPWVRADHPREDVRGREGDRPDAPEPEEPVPEHPLA